MAKLFFRYPAMNIRIGEDSQRQQPQSSGLRALHLRPTWTG
jgi:hypothetical protein